MTEQEKTRLIELLIKEVDATGEAEGVWFGEIKNSVELIGLLIKYQPDEPKWPQLLEAFKKVHKL